MFPAIIWAIGLTPVIGSIKSLTVWPILLLPSKLSPALPGPPGAAGLPEAIAAPPTGLAAGAGMAEAGGGFRKRGKRME